MLLFRCMFSTARKLVLSIMSFVTNFCRFLEQSETLNFMQFMSPVSLLYFPDYVLKLSCDIRGSVSLRTEAVTLATIFFY